MLSESQILQEFTDAGAILRGHFILSSGLHADTYMQCARVLMDPVRAERLCAALAQRVRAQIQTPFDLVVSPAMGGVIVGYELARQLGVPAIFCEREAGSFTLRRGFTLPPGARVLLVEDVVTTGKSSLETLACVHGLGGEVVAEAALVDRSGGAHGLPCPLVALLSLEIATYASDALPPALAAIPPVKPGSRFLAQGGAAAGAA